MRTKEGYVGIGTSILGIMVWLLQQVAEARSMITQNNADPFFIVAIILGVVGVSLMVKGFWPRSVSE